MHTCTCKLTCPPPPFEPSSMCEVAVPHAVSSNIISPEPLVAKTPNQVATAPNMVRNKAAAITAFRSRSKNLNLHER